ncbi:hypothetical protein Tco_0062907, partial [Tanacetum coccineum]
EGRGGVNEFSFASVGMVCVRMKDLWPAKQVHWQVFGVGEMSGKIRSSEIKRICANGSVHKGLLQNDTSRRDAWEYS